MTQKENLLIATKPKQEVTIKDAIDFFKMLPGFYFESDRVKQIYALTIQALTEIESLPKIHGWIARDSYEDAFEGTGLILHYSRPQRVFGEWGSNTIAMHLPSHMFPEITWESEPVEVELLIRKVKED